MLKSLVKRAYIVPKPCTKTLFRATKHRCHSGCSHHSHSKTLTKSLHSKITQELINDEALLGTDPELKDILENNRNFMNKKKQQYPEYFPRTGKQQDPKYLYVGCSDARVNPNDLMGLPHDEVFVTRNIGNQIAPGDLNILSVFEFSLGVLGIPHVVVCGHTECGAIKGASANSSTGGTGPLEHWLRHIRDIRRLYDNELSQIKDQDQYYRRLAELNVVEQCYNLYKTPIVQKLRAEKGLPLIHGVLYDVKDGSLTKLDINFDKEELYKVY